MKTAFWLIVGLLVIGGAYVIGKSPAQDNSKETKVESNSTDDMPATKATIETSRGKIVIQLDGEHAPKTVSNFVNKSKTGYYNNLTFHRVEDWVIQGGDPDGNGTGGGDQDTELSDQPFTTGAVGVARAGDIKVSNDSQFFIVKSDSTFLDKQYTYFGMVIDGMDIVNQIQIGDQIKSITVE